MSIRSLLATLLIVFVASAISAPQPSRVGDPELLFEWVTLVMLLLLFLLPFLFTELIRTMTGHPLPSDSLILLLANMSLRIMPWLVLSSLFSDRKSDPPPVIASDFLNFSFKALRVMMVISTLLCRAGDLVFHQLSTKSSSVMTPSSLEKIIPMN